MLCKVTHCAARILTKQASSAALGYMMDALPDTGIKKPNNYAIQNKPATVTAIIKFVKTIALFPGPVQLSIACLYYGTQIV